MVTDLKKSPLAPEKLPTPPMIDGVRLAVARAGYKNWTRDDLALVAFAPGTVVAGVTTQSLCPSPEVEWCRHALAGGQARALVVNAGNSNAFTGKRGADALNGVIKTAASALDCPPETAFVASTGVIGVPLPLDRAQAGIAKAAQRLDDGPPTDWVDVAHAIMTTDTFPKIVHAQARIGGETVDLVGIAKGSGMIAPDMATMLAFVFTNARIDAPVLQDMLRAANDRSFSCITVDGDTSTSDTLLVFATGQAAHAPIRQCDDPGADALAAALDAVCQTLAQYIVRDGEGAHKFISIDVQGAKSDRAARVIARTIANSPLVKTAIGGGDANWGRIVMAVGKAGEEADRDRLSIRFGGIEVAHEGAVVEGYDEAPVAAHLQGQNVDICVDLGLGDGRARVWTCDLTHDYIHINGDYRT